MKKTWFIWGSIFSFFILFSSTMIKIVLLHRPFSIELWMQFVLKTMVLLIGVIMLPCGLLLVAMVYVQGFSHSLATGINVIILIYVYFSGVYACSNLTTWNH